MQHFDTDGNGLIDFHEYLLIVTLMSIPLKVHSALFRALVTIIAASDYLISCTPSRFHTQYDACRTRR